MILVAVLRLHPHIMESSTFDAMNWPGCKTAEKMLFRYLGWFQNCHPKECLEALHAVDVLTFVGQIIRLRIIERGTVSNISILHFVR